MRILISNDDGVHAEGIHALAEEFSDHDIYIVAPERERSTTGHSLTLHKPLRLHRYSPKIFSVSGGPADCIYVGINEVLKRKPDLVLSGINRGANLGQDVFYSGTVSAAREAANLGIPAMAISLDLSYNRDNKVKHYSSAAKAARKVLEKIIPHFSTSKKVKKNTIDWPASTLINVNVPNLPFKKIKGYRSSTQGTRVYGSNILRRKDARGREYFWIGGTYQGFKPAAKSDCASVDQGYVAITPLELDTTMMEVYESLKTVFRD